MKVLILDNNALDAGKIIDLFGKSCSIEEHFEVRASFKEFNDLYIKEKFNILFINIDYETKKVLEFLEEFQGKTAYVVITSHQNNMMIEAHKHKIIGYLSKPYTLDEFKQVVFRIAKRSRLFSGDEEHEDHGHFKDLIAEGRINRIALTTLDGYVIVHYDDIIGSFLMLTKTLKHYASKLEQHGFFRVHKTHLVNLKYIRSYIKGKNSYVELKDGSNIEVSSRKKQTLVEKLNN